MGNNNNRDGLDEIQVRLKKASAPVSILSTAVCWPKGEITAQHNKYRKLRTQGVHDCPCVEILLHGIVQGLLHVVLTRCLLLHVSTERVDVEGL